MAGVAAARNGADLTAMEVLAKPFGYEDRTGPEMWIDEAIWGHRLQMSNRPG